MTIIASVKARDGIVLATDSMSTIIRRDPAGQVALVKTFDTVCMNVSTCVFFGLMFYS